MIAAADRHLIWRRTRHHIGTHGAAQRRRDPLAEAKQRPDIRQGRSLRAIKPVPECGVTAQSLANRHLRRMANGFRFPMLVRIAEPPWIGGGVCGRRPLPPSPSRTSHREMIDKHRWLCCKFQLTVEFRLSRDGLIARPFSEMCRRWCRESERSQGPAGQRPYEQSHAP